MYNPIATYRLQFHKDFSFKDFKKIIPYLTRLGVGTIYASPLLESTPGSTHGYDAVNPHLIDPEIGDQEEFVHLRKALDREEIGWIQDIVPNHMAFDPSNPWLMDVLEKGEKSGYARFFDIAWNTPLFEGSIMVPFLGAPLEEVLAQGELTIKYVNERLVFTYQENNYPLHPKSYATVLQVQAPSPPEKKIQEFLKKLEELHGIDDQATYADTWDGLRSQWDSLMDSGTTRGFIKQQLKTINASTKLLQQITDQQCYRLCDWQETDNQINFRRFFTVNGLICLNIQNDEVFHHYHTLIKSLLDTGLIQGLRIDHIDGLYDPSGYLSQLREMAGDETYIAVEKILEAGETLPTQWPIQGTTGYEFLAQVNNLMTQPQHESDFTTFYHQLIKDTPAPAQLQREKKELILRDYMAGELDNLYQLFLSLNLIDKRILASIHRDDMKDAIGEFLIQCPVYRYYGNSFPLEAEEAAAVEKILSRARRYDPDLHHAVSMLEEVLLRKPHQGDKDWNSRALYFYQRCMQFTGPLMAKGVEDTLMYIYNRFVGHNEVGDTPEAFGSTIPEFHDLMQARQTHWPLSLNATSTHDTKRGEDARARLNVLTDLPEEWFAKVKEWQSLTADWHEEDGPDVNDTYFIYQTLVASYPMPEAKEEERGYPERLEAYLEKALREGKINSNWAEPNEAYEAAAKKFAVRLLEKGSPFWKSFADFQQKVVEHGIINSLSQVILKFTAPGVPDLYQGCELWDLSLVDPDNRRPVDFAQREKWLAQMAQEAPQPLLEKLWKNRTNGQIKLWITHQLFALRQQQPDLFLYGDYIPLSVEGTYKDHIVAFIRKRNRHSCLIALPLHTAQLCQEQGTEITALDWKDTAILLPEGTSQQWKSFASPEEITYKDKILVQSIFEPLPFVVLNGIPAVKERSAGVLMHISSLVSPFGIGDMGPQAFVFADFLQRSHQRYWQLLPLNPVEEKQGNSPYSAISSRAGNTLFISPDLLVKEGFLDKSDLAKYHFPAADRINYAEVRQSKEELFHKAYVAFSSSQEADIATGFELFCEENESWLQDFALYSVLKDRFKGKAWFEWPKAYKQRDEKAISKLLEEESDQIRKVKWLQYIFFRQWKHLKDYCNKKDVWLLGDLPIYVSYDSSDVWVHQSLFHLDKEGRLTGVAGVPPDAFSDDGQLWGMPVYQWDVLKEQNYEWWIDRFQKNMVLFDLIRLDHFRGFSSYWEVPGDEKTAVNGTWKTGPGSDFFKVVEKALGGLPFVAEDLGDIDSAVLELRDEFNLPGMKVLHFAFSENMPENEFIPHNHAHNFVTYTGTHDNNTTKGWYRKDIDAATRNRIEQYAGREVGENNIHQVMARMAYASVSKIAILPVQDVLGLDEKARMNTPASMGDNWSWRLKPGQITEAAEKQLKQLAWIYNRD